MNSVIAALIASTPVLQAISPFDCMIALSDKEIFLFFLPGKKSRIDIKIGQSIGKGDGLWEA